MNLPDQTDENTHNGQETVTGKHETKCTWDEDDHRPPVFQEIDVLDPSHDERQPDDTCHEKQYTPEEFSK